VNKSYVGLSLRSPRRCADRTTTTESTTEKNNVVLIVKETNNGEGVGGFRVQVIHGRSAMEMGASQDVGCER
jgi:hypothetical protein